MRHGWTRRELIGAGAAATLGYGIAAPATAAAGPPNDHELLTATLRVERLVAWVYERVLERGTLRPATRSTVEMILAQERQHAAMVEAVLGGSAPTQSFDLATAERELARHHVGASATKLSTERDSLRLLVDVESVAEGAWFAAIAKLADPGLASTAAAIMACEAQHWTVLAGLAHHQDPKIMVPYPFVRGSVGY